MKFVIQLKDIVVLNIWATFYSKIGMFSLIVFSLFVSIVLILPNITNNNSLVYFISLVGSFGAASAVLIVASIPLILLMIVINLLNSGILGEREILISADTILEKNTQKIIKLPWSDIKNIHLTKYCIFVKYTSIKYIIIPRRDFKNYCEFVKFYSDIIQYRHEQKKKT